MSFSDYSASYGGLAQYCVFPFVDGAPRRPPRSTQPIETSLSAAYHAAHAKTINHGLGTGPAHELIDRILFEQGLDPNKHRLALSVMNPIEHALSVVAQDATCEAEVSLAYNVRSKKARVLGKDLRRRYDLGEDECAGTVDTLCFRALDGVGSSRKAFVSDLKCGPMANDRIEPAKANLQLAQLAHWVMLANEGIESVVVEIVRVLPDGKQFTDSFEHDALSLSDVDDFLLSIYNRIAAKEGPQPGIHCTEHYCPILGACPAHQASIVRSLPEEQLVGAREFSLAFSSVEELSSPRHAAVALATFKALEKICEAKIKILKTYVDTYGPLDVGAGKVFRRIEKTKREVIGRSVEQIIEILSKRFPEEAVRKVVHATVHVSQIEWLSKTYSPNREISKQKREAEKDLEAAGIVARTVSIEYRVGKSGTTEDNGE